MNIIKIDYEKKTLQSDFFLWQIIANDKNKFLLLQREESGRYHAAEADVKKKHLWEVKEISFRGSEGDTYFFDEETGIDKI
jgi:hypothetical protein